MSEITLKNETGKSPDFTLILSKLEKQILSGANPEKANQILAREDIWRQVEVQEQLRWARLAQMAGHVEISLAVLAHINHNNPKSLEAWENRIELLYLLDRRKELAQVLAQGREVLDRSSVDAWMNRLGQSGKVSGDEDIVAEATPFDRLRSRQQAVSHYLDLFAGREDCFARQWANKPEGKQGYVPVRRPMDFGDAEEHLAGRKTYGIYLLKSDSTVRLAVMDVDLDAKFRDRKLKADEKRLLKREFTYLVSRLKEEAKKADLSPLLEFSGGKGFHFWFFFSSPVAAGRARQILGSLKAGIAPDLSAFNMEVFPKQDHLSGKGYGNLVKLPLGIHRLTGKKSYFPDCQDRSTEAQLAHLGRVQPSSIEGVGAALHRLKREKIVVHPRMQQWAGQFPDLAKLERLCPPLGQVIAACRQGKSPSVREEKVLFQTIGFLPKSGTYIHHLLAFLPEYNPHMVDYKLSRLRGSPLGCRRIHSLLSYSADLCTFQGSPEYIHPLLHLGESHKGSVSKAEKRENLSSAIENLKISISQVERFLK